MEKYSNSICGNESNDSDSSSEITDITITAGIFFDGTNNNKYNVDFWENGLNIHPSDKEGYELYRKLKDDTDAGHYASYKDSIKTNIAELWYMYCPLSNKSAQLNWSLSCALLFDNVQSVRLQTFYNNLKRFTYGLMQSNTGIVRKEYTTEKDLMMNSRSEIVMESDSKTNFASKKLPK